MHCPVWNPGDSTIALYFYTSIRIVLCVHVFSTAKSQHLQPYIHLSKAKKKEMEVIIIFTDSKGLIGPYPFFFSAISLSVDTKPILVLVSFHDFLN